MHPQRLAFTVLLTLIGMSSNAGANDFQDNISNRLARQLQHIGTLELTQQQPLIQYYNDAAYLADDLFKDQRITQQEQRQLRRTIRALRERIEQTNPVQSHHPAEETLDEYAPAPSHPTEEAEYAEPWRPKGRLLHDKHRDKIYW